MKPLIKINEHCKKIDDDYFKNYGGDNYSKTYSNYTVPANNIIEDLIGNNVIFDTLLDVGCASGELVSDLRRLGIKAYGIENNKNILNKSIVPEYCIQLDIKNLNDIKPNSFDVIYTNSMMYVSPKDVLPILNMMWVICKKAVYFYCPILGESFFQDPYRTFLASRTWWDKQFAEANFIPLDENIYKKVNSFS